jgi:ketosteroid isomerase-like protein
MCIYAPFLGLSLVIAVPAQAAPADDAAAAVRKVIGSFNAGNIKAFFSAHEDGALIVDEFAPYVWRGHRSAERWAADYERDAKRRHISGGRVDVQKPSQANSDGRSAYIVFPSTYSFAQDGKKLAGRGSMTFVLRRHANEWKIASWTYSGAAPLAQ